MHWREYLREHGQRPDHWWRVLTPAYWRQLNRERTATTSQQTTRIPCGKCVITHYHSPDGQEVRRDVAIVIGRGFGMKGN